MTRTNLKSMCKRNSKQWIRELKNNNVVCWPSSTQKRLPTYAGNNSSLWSWFFTWDTQRLQEINPNCSKWAIPNFPFFHFSQPIMILTLRSVHKDWILFLMILNYPRSLQCVFPTQSHSQFAFNQGWS